MNINWQRIRFWICVPGALFLILFSKWMSQKAFMQKHFGDLFNDTHLMSGQLLGITMLTTYMISKFFWESVVAGSDQVVGSNGMQFNFNKNQPMIPAGRWAIQPINGINVLRRFMNLPGRKGAVIAPFPAFLGFGRLRLVRGPLEPVSFLDLPNEVKKKLLAWGIPPPYFWSRAPEYVEMRGKDYAREWRQTTIATRDMWADEKIAIRSVTTADESHRRLTPLLNASSNNSRGGILSKLFSPKPKDTADEKFEERAQTQQN